jgi:hypothetical protein
MESLHIRCSASLPTAIDKAASPNMRSFGEYVRRCVIDRLRAEGIDPSAACADAGQSMGMGIMEQGLSPPDFSGAEVTWTPVFNGMAIEKRRAA